MAEHSASMWFNGPVRPVDRARPASRVDTGMLVVLSSHGDVPNLPAGGTLRDAVRPLLSQFLYGDPANLGVYKHNKIADETAPDGGGFWRDALQRYV